MRIEKAEMKQAVDRLKHFTTSAKAPIDPRSRLVHFVNKDGVATMFASDLKNMGKAYMQTGAEDEFEFCTTYEAVARTLSFRGKEFDIELPEGENCVLFKQGKSEIKGPREDDGSLGALEALAFVPEDAKCIEINAGDFAKRLKLAGVAVNEKAKEQEIAQSCISFASDGKDICLKSTDKFRISGWKSSESLLENDSAVMKGLLPMDCRFFPSYFDSDDMIKFYLYDGKVACVSGKFEAYGADIEQPFPVMEKLLEQPAVASYEVSVGELAASLGIVFDDSSDQEDKKKVTLLFDDDSLGVSINSKTGLASTDSFPITKLSGDPGAKYAFPVQQRFLKEAVASISESDKLTFELKSTKNKYYMLVYRTESGGFGMFTQMR